MKFRVFGMAWAAVPMFLAAQDTALTLKSVIHEPQAGYVVAEFSQAVDRTGPQVDVSQVKLDGVTVIKAFREALQIAKIEVQFSGELPQTSKLCFAAVTYTTASGSHTANNLCGDVASTDPVAEKEKLLTKFQGIPKTAADKDIFATGFVTTASGGSVGGADITLNGLIQASGLNTFLNIKKATGKNADPKHFEGGVSYQVATPWSRKTLQQLRDAAPGTATNDLVKKLQARLIAGSMFSSAAKLEGDATQFNVANFVGEESYQLRTESKALFGKNGFWRGFLMPVAFEGGKTLNTTGTAAAGSASSPPPVKWLARYKAGAGFTAFYEDWANDLPIKRVDFDLNVVLRDRFLREQVFDNSTNSATATGDGIRMYGEAAVKIYVGQTSSARYGVRLSYNRGSLPPVFARVSSLQLGFMFETTDDRTKPGK
jgi:hypothetical protein